MAIIEDGLVGKPRYLAEPLDIWRGRPGTGRDQKSCGPNEPVADGDGVGVNEARTPEDHINTPFGQSLRIFCPIHLFNRAADVFTNLRHVNRDGRSDDAKPRGGSGFLRDFGRVDERLAGDASGPRAVTADPVLFDQCNPRTKPRREGSRSQPAGARANDSQIVWLFHVCFSVESRERRARARRAMARVAKMSPSTASNPPSHPARRDPTIAPTLSSTE